MGCGCGAGKSEADEFGEIAFDLKRATFFATSECWRVEDDDVKTVFCFGQARKEFADVLGNEVVVLSGKVVEFKIGLASPEGRAGDVYAGGDGVFPSCCDGKRAGVGEAVEELAGF